LHAHSVSSVSANDKFRSVNGGVGYFCHGFGKCTDVSAGMKGINGLKSVDDEKESGA